MIIIIIYNAVNKNTFETCKTLGNFFYFKSSKTKNNKFQSSSFKVYEKKYEILLTDDLLITWLDIFANC